MAAYNKRFGARRGVRPETVLWLTVGWEICAYEKIFYLLLF
jgi:hypothetical protein